MLKLPKRYEVNLRPPEFHCFNIYRKGTRDSNPRISTGSLAKLVRQPESYITRNPQYKSRIRNKINKSDITCLRSEMSDFSGKAC